MIDTWQSNPKASRQRWCSIMTSQRVILIEGFFPGNAVDRWIHFPFQFSPTWWCMRAAVLPRSSESRPGPAAASRSRRPSWPPVSPCGAGSSGRLAGWHYCSDCCRCCSPAAPRCSALFEEHTRTYTPMRPSRLWAWSDWVYNGKTFTSLLLAWIVAFYEWWKHLYSSTCSKQNSQLKKKSYKTQFNRRSILVSGLA